MFASPPMTARRNDCYNARVSLPPIAAEYVRTHRADCTDAEIRRALKEQGFSDELLDAAFAAAGARPAPPPGLRAKRAIVRLLAAISALCFLAAGALFVRNLIRATSAPAQAR